MRVRSGLFFLFRRVGNERRLTRTGLSVISPPPANDPINTDILERSYVWEDRTPIGTFSSVFTSRIQSSLIALARLGGASVVDRLK